MRTTMIPKMRRVGTHGVSSLLARAGGWTLLRSECKWTILLFLVTCLLLSFNSLTALAQTDGPWTYSSHRIGYYDYDTNNSISYNNLNNSEWPASYGTGTLELCQGNNAIAPSGDSWITRGIGFRNQNCFFPANGKFGLFSLFSHSENVPAYTRKVLKWDYQLYQLISQGGMTQTLALYGSDNLDALKAANVDFTPSYTNQSGSQYYFSRSVQNGGNSSIILNNFSNSISFDNRNSSSTQSKECHTADIRLLHWLCR